MNYWSADVYHNINRLVQERCNSSALAMELRLCCTNLLICSTACHLCTGSDPLHGNWRSISFKAPMFACVSDAYAFQETSVHFKSVMPCLWLMFWLFWTGDVEGLYNKNKSPRWHCTLLARTDELSELFQIILNQTTDLSKSLWSCEKMEF